MQRAIEKATVLIEALPYIQRFKGETILVKFGGSIMEDPEGVAEILRDIAFMACVGMRPVIVHGGGKAISKRMQAAGLTPHFVNGRRVTDPATIRLVEDVLKHEVNPVLVQTLESYDCTARGLHGDTLIRAERLTGRDPATGAALDWGFVGRIAGVDAAPVRAFLDAGITPVITPLGRGVTDQQLYNINADDVAAAMAAALNARKLVFLSDVPGVLTNAEDPTSLISSVHVGEVEDLIQRGIIHGGMVPKLSGGIQALKAGVKKTHIIDASLPHSLLLELFTDRGVGTEILP